MARQNIAPPDQDTLAAMWQLDGGDTTQEFEGIVGSSEPLITTLNLRADCGANRFVGRHTQSRGIARKKCLRQPKISRIPAFSTEPLA